MKPLLSLTIAAIKRYVRNKGALFFSLVVPIFLIFLFGFFTNGSTQFNLGLYNGSNSADAEKLVNTIYCSNPVKCDKNNSDDTKNSAFKVKESSNLDDLKESLRKGDLSGILIIPDTFNASKPSQLQFLKNEGKAQDTGAMSLILNQMTNNLYNINPASIKVSISEQNFESRNLTIIDFLVPGILGINLMSIGLFSVAFAFVTLKNSGALKRLLATPINGADIIISEGVSRAIVGLAQILLFLGVAVWFFNLKIQGNVFTVVFLCLLALITFLSIGFGIAGYAKDENQVAPLAQLINLPMTFLSGAFISRDLFPGWLHTITDFLPLTYLTDALRNVMNNGATLWDVRGQVLGLIVWAIISLLIAIKVFRWN